MAKQTKRPTKRRPSGTGASPAGSGRATPKGGADPAVPRQQTGRQISPDAGGRYTAPVPRSQKVSPRWLPVLMFGLLAIGGLLIMANYIGVLPGGEPSNVYLFGGLALILAGIITSTQYH